MTISKLKELAEARGRANEGRWSAQMVKNRWEIDDGDLSICRMTSKPNQDNCMDFITLAANTDFAQMAREVEELVEALRDMQFAYGNKDEEEPHDFEIAAQAKAKQLIEKHGGGDE